MCKDAPQPDPAIGQAAAANAEIARESLAFYKDVYTNDLLPMQKENQALAKTLVDKFLDSQEKQAKFADEQNAYYESTFKPVEEKMAKEAMEYDGDENVNRRMGIAAANVNQQFSNAEQQNARSLSRFGLNPNSSAFAATNAKLMRDKALASSGAQTGAAFDTQDKAIALRAGVANFGRNMPNTAATYYANSNSAGGQAMGTSTQAMNNVGNNAAVMNTGYGTSMSGNNAAISGYSTDYNARMQAYNSEQQAFGDLVGMATKAGIGYATGGMSGMGNMMAGRKIFADGGQVDGPGGPVDDKVPAMLSDGEYVIPADVVKAKGIEFFDKLKSKYHVPAQHQRRHGINRG